MVCIFSKQKNSKQKKGNFNFKCNKLILPNHFSKGISREDENFKACLGLELRADDDIEVSAIEIQFGKRLRFIIKHF